MLPWQLIPVWLHRSCLALIARLVLVCFVTNTVVVRLKINCFSDRHFRFQLSITGLLLFLVFQNIFLNFFGLWARWSLQMSISYANVRHATKSSNFVTRLCCCWTKLSVWHRELPDFWRVEQLNCWIETIYILWQFLALSPSCDWSIVCLRAREFLLRFLTFTWRLS